MVGIAPDMLVVCGQARIVTPRRSAPPERTTSESFPTSYDFTPNTNFASSHNFGTDAYSLRVKATLVMQHQEDEEPFGFFKHLADDELSIFCPSPRISSYLSGQHGPVSTRNYITGHFKWALRKDARQRRNDPVVSSAAKIFGRLPVELKLTVLEWLHPLDLYHLSLTNREFRSLLMHPRSSGVWTSVLEAAAFPKPPLTVSNPQWVATIFGPGACKACAHYGALGDFALGKWFCDHCLSKNTITKTQAAHRMEYNALGITNDTHIAFSLLPWSPRIYGCRHMVLFHDGTNARYIIKDLKAMAKKVQLIEILVAWDMPELDKAWEEYKILRMAYVKYLSEVSRHATNWAMDVYRTASCTIEDTIRVCTNRVQNKLVNLGHARVDVDACLYYLSHYIRLERMFRYSPSAFRLKRMAFEHPVIKRREDRLRQERKTLARKIYQAYQKSLPPNNWQYMPPSELVDELPALNAFFNLPLTDRGDLSPGELVPHFPRFVADWTTNMQNAVVATLPSSGSSQETFESKLDKLELATSVFTCRDCDDRSHHGWVRVGWRDICRHACYKPFTWGLPCTTLEHNDDLSMTALNIVYQLGLDPSTTTWRDMDALDARFICGNCPTETQNRVTGLKVYTWKECLMHTHDMKHRPSHITESWRQLSLDARRFVLHHEKPLFPRNQEIWRCNHCATNYDTPGTLDSVLHHLETLHLIKKPVMGKNFAPDLRRSLPPRRLFRLGTEPPLTCVCLKCNPNIPVFKLWTKANLMKHMRTAHSLTDPVGNNQDYREISLFVQ